MHPNRNYSEESRLTALLREGRELLPPESHLVGGVARRNPPPVFALCTFLGLVRATQHGLVRFTLRNDAEALFE